MGYFRKKPNRGCWGHGISRGIEERAYGNSRGQLKKKWNFQGCSRETHVEFTWIMGSPVWDFFRNSSMWPPFSTLQERPSSLFQFGQEKKCTWTLNWKKILLICFENCHRVFPIPTGRVPRNWIMDPFIVVNITLTCRGSLEDEYMLDDS